MWMVVMFDLPVVEKAERKAATPTRQAVAVPEADAQSVRIADLVGGVAPAKWHLGQAGKLQAEAHPDRFKAVGKEARDRSRRQGCSRSSPCVWSA